LFFLNELGMLLIIGLTKFILKDDTVAMQAIAARRELNKTTGTGPPAVVVGF